MSQGCLRCGLPGTAAAIITRLLSPGRSDVCTYLRYTLIYIYDANTNTITADGQKGVYIKHVGGQRITTHIVFCIIRYIVSVDIKLKYLICCNSYKCIVRYSCKVSCIAEVCD